MPGTKIKYLFCTRIKIYAHTPMLILNPYTDNSAKYINIHIYVYCTLVQNITDTMMRRNKIMLHGDR